jgi:hypothetical protein
MRKILIRVLLIFAITFVAGLGLLVFNCWPFDDSEESQTQPIIRETMIDPRLFR